MRPLIFLILLSLFVIQAQMQTQAQAQAQIGPLLCDLESLPGLGEIELRRVKQAPFTLIDSQEKRWRLAGIQVLDRQAAETAIVTLARGKSLKVKLDAKPQDRYDDTWAYLSVEDRSLAKSLVSLGLAAAWPRDGRQACVEGLLATERHARRRQQGVWADLYPFDAAMPDNWSEGRQGQFVLVSGTIKAAEQNRKGYYINFGQDYRTDTTAFIAKKLLKRWQADLPEAGQQVLVRGYLDYRGGPFIELFMANQLQILKSAQ